MRLIFNEINADSFFLDYNMYQEIVSEYDCYTMYKMSRTLSSDPSGTTYHYMIYLESGRITPQEIFVNSNTNIIEKITLFVSRDQAHKTAIENYLIDDIDFECKIVLDECTDDWSGRFCDIMKASTLLWADDGKCIYFIFSDAPKTLKSYCISRNLKILIDSCENIQGFSILQ